VIYPNIQKISMKYKRILLKLSGEALMGSQQFGIDPLRLEQYAKDVQSVQEMGVEIAIVIGGGNIFRGVEAEKIEGQLKSIHAQAKPTKSGKKAYSPSIYR